jgi:hypothetical protein
MADDEEGVKAGSLGDRLQVFTPMMANTIAGFIISALLLVGGAAAICFPLRAAYVAGWDLPVNVNKGWSWLAVGLFCLIGTGLTVGGGVLATYCYGLISHRVEVWTNGFRYCSRQSVEEVFWADIDRIRETVLYERPPILKGPAKLLLPKLTSISYTVMTVSGKEYGFDGNSVKSIKRFGKLLREQADRLSLPWETVEEHA